MTAPASRLARLGVRLRRGLRLQLGVQHLRLLRARRGEPHRGHLRTPATHPLQHTRAWLGLSTPTKQHILETSHRRTALPLTVLQASWQLIGFAECAPASHVDIA